MSSDEMDAFRAELLRQKLIFEAELVRQREHFEERLATISQELADREADCRNLQAVVTILGKKIDLLSEQHLRRPATPRRSATPQRGGAEPSTPEREPAPAAQVGRSFVRRPSPLISTSASNLNTSAVSNMGAANTPSAGTSYKRVPSLTSFTRTNSPGRALAHPRAPRATGSAAAGGATSRPSSRLRTNSSGRNASNVRKRSTHAVAGVSAKDDW